MDGETCTHTVTLTGNLSIFTNPPNGMIVEDGRKPVTRDQDQTMNAGAVHDIAEP